MEGSTVTISDCHPGDMLAVIEDGATSYVLLGRLLCMNDKHDTIHGALVDSVDPEALVYVPGEWRSIDADAEVLAVIETGAKRRESTMRAYRERMKRATGHDPHQTQETGDIDPMLARARGGGW